MTGGNDWIQAYLPACKCGNHHPVEIETIRIEAGVLVQAAQYIKQKGFTKIGMIVDSNTLEAAGRQLGGYLNEQGLDFVACIIKPDRLGDVVADEQSIVQALLEIPNDTDVLLAVGSGTLHDITRFIAFKIGIPFISVPTAASVDGFTSLGAPLIIRGFKQTISAVSPIALFADLEVLVKAPKQLAAAGFGDMLGKYTSLFDWRFSSWIAGEAYCEAAAAITADALKSCVEHADLIASGDREGVEILIRALVLSGLAMLIFGASHPASGAEHHLSHLWEMDLLQNGKRQILHGLKVGAACAVISGLYKETAANADLEAVLERIERHGDQAIADQLRQHWTQILAAAEAIPQPEQLKNLLDRVGGAINPEQLGIEPGVVETSLREAHKIRNRHTLLWLKNSFSL